MGTGLLLMMGSTAVAFKQWIGHWGHSHLYLRHYKESDSCQGCYNVGEDPLIQSNVVGTSSKFVWTMHEGTQSVSFNARFCSLYSLIWSKGFPTFLHPHYFNSKLWPRPYQIDFSSLDIFLKKHQEGGQFFLNNRLNSLRRGWEGFTFLCYGFLEN